MAATPFQFADSAAPLFGVYHHADRSAPAMPAALLLNPFGDEAIRAQRTMRRLAVLLARRGAPTLRFDYYGAGDSAGACEDVSLARMRADVGAAQAELAAMSGRTRFVWIGLGLGAAAAWMAAGDSACAPERLILWHGVVRGADYLESLKTAHAGWLARALDRPAALRSRSDDGEALGFALGDGLRRELGGLDLAAAPVPAISEAVTVGAVDAGRRALMATAEAAGVAVQTVAPDAPAYLCGDGLAAPQPPAATLEAIVQTVAGAA